jgi:hypothetical protein
VRPAGGAGRVKNKIHFFSGASTLSALQAGHFSQITLLGKTGGAVAFRAAAAGYRPTVIRPQQRASGSPPARTSPDVVLGIALQPGLPRGTLGALRQD